MKTRLSVKTWLMALALPILPLAASAQTTVTAPAETDWGPHQGNDEFTISGNGTSNKQVTDSLGGADFSFGNYVTNTTEILLRQSVNYTNPGGPSGQAWDGSTTVGVDQLLVGQGPLRPYVGANLGGVYGQTVSDSFVAGLEGGLKYYVAPRTFVYAALDYDWYFRHGAAIVSDKFNQGQWNWGLGLGFNF